MPTGRCRLCLETKELKRSHYMPAALYDLAKRAGSANPVVVTQEVAIQISNQAQADLLCSECEERLNNGGETWVLRNRWLSETQSPLHAVLAAATPVPGSRDEVAVYEGGTTAGLDMDKLVYFAASVFWRGAVYDWRIRNLGTTRLDLGPYEEELRLFLLGEAEFPKDAVLVVTVSGSPQVLHNEFVMFPFLKHHEVQYRSYKFMIPGMTFTLLTGKALPEYMRVGCAVRSPQRYVFTGSKMDELNLNDAGALISQARRVGKVR
jgi:hypothetical protein